MLASDGMMSYKAEWLAAKSPMHDSSDAQHLESSMHDENSRLHELIASVKAIKSFLLNVFLVICH